MGHPFRQDSGRGNNDGDERQSKGVQQGQLQERMETIREALDEDAAREHRETGPSSCGGSAQADCRDRTVTKARHKSN